MDQFAGWTKILALAQEHKTKAALREAIVASGIQILETEPLSGYYRCAAAKDGPLLPVAIWRDGGKLMVFRDGNEIALERVWPYSVWNPVSYDWYEDYTERGIKWPDAAAAVEPAQAEESAVPAVEAPPTAAASTAPEPELTDEEAELAALTKSKEAATIKAKITAAIATAKENHFNILSEEAAAAAQSARAGLNKFSTDSDKRRKALMQPWQSKADAIHETWQPLVKLAKEGADDIRKALNTWENRPRPAPTPVVPTPVKVPTAQGNVSPSHNEPPTASTVVQLPAQQQKSIGTGVIKGETGRAARVTLKKVATVTDYDALYAHVKAFPEVEQVLEQIAQRLVMAGETVPGVEVNETRDVA